MKTVRKLDLAGQNELAAIFTDRVNFDRLERKMYSHDVASMPGLVKPLLRDTLPAAVVKPANEEELVELIKFSLRNKVPVVPRGAATSGYGGVLPVKGGIVVDMSLFNQVKDIDMTNLTVTIQSGAVWEDVEKKLSKNALSLRVMPTSSPSSTAGGWFAQGGAGLGSFAYGAFRDNVVSVKVVLADGTIKEFTGPEPDTLYGAMGTTGIITELKVMVKMNEPVTVFGAQFNEPASLAAVLASIREMELPVWSAGFLNPEGARLKNTVPLKTHNGHVAEERVLLPEAYILILATHDPVAGKWIESAVKKSWRGYA